jgi:hypothetical protein
MNKVILAAIAVLALQTFAANDKTLTPEQLERKEESRRRTGGLVLDVRNQKGKVVILNGQCIVAEDAILSVAKELSDMLKIRVEVAKWAPTPLSEAGKGLSECDGNIKIVLSDMENQPALAIFPDELWAFVGVTAINGGKVEKRLQNQIRRAFAYACGCGSDSGIMARIDKPAQLERFADTDLTYAATQSMLMYLSAAGVTPGRNVLYIRACKEGWAPAPTNEIQQAVWDKVHAMPTEPLKIAPETTKQK